jgi:hypothetical protein
MTTSKKFVQAVILVAAVMAFLVASSSARPLVGGDGWGAGEAVVSGEHILQLLRRLYMQQLQAGPSCETNSTNGGCPPPSR